jgi:hypothetical protein
LPLFDNQYLDSIVGVCGIFFSCSIKKGKILINFCFRKRMKAYLVHGWGGSPIGEGFNWLKHRLKEGDIEAIAPFMPDTDRPKIKEWVEELKKVVDSKEGYILIGHSIGCQAIMRYLESLDEGNFLSCVFVAPWFDLKEETYESSDDRKIAKPWIETRIDFEKVKKRCGNFVCFFSDDDPFVDPKQSKEFKKALNCEVVMEKGKGHYDSVEGWGSVLEKVLEIKEKK